MRTFERENKILAMANGDPIQNGNGSRAEQNLAHLLASLASGQPDSANLARDAFAHLNCDHHDYLYRRTSRPRNPDIQQRIISFEP